MDLLIKNGNVFYKNKFQQINILVDDKKNIKYTKHIKLKPNTKIINAGNLTIIPGLIDVHTHLRQPGYEYKGTIKTETKAASVGGFTTICCMPNTKPIIDSVSELKKIKLLINKNGIINVLPYCSITVNEQGKQIVDIKKTSSHCIAFSDDGCGIKDSSIMKQAMKQIESTNKVIACHCEIDGSETKEVIRNIELAKQTKCKLHICHVSTKSSIDVIKKAKKQKINVTCEVTPHHLLLNKDDIKDNGAYKMNPPLSSKQDQSSLLKAIKDGTINMIVTDHAPHSDKEKNCNYQKSLNGIVGLETSFSLMYTKLVKSKIITLEKLVELMSINPNKRFDLNQQSNNLTIVDLNQKYKIDSHKFFSKSKISPFNN
jgi:dihydroorotase